MGGGGFLGLGPAPKAPEAPDYLGAARETAQGNLQSAQAATAANRVSQVTPYGNLNYKQTGTDTAGNPMWTATTSLSPTGSALLDAQNRASLGLSDLFDTQLGQVKESITGGFNPTLPELQYNLKTPELQTELAGTGMEGWDRANALLMERLQPTLDRQTKAFQAEMANRGIVPGTEAYKNASRDLAMKQNDLVTQAQLAGQNVQNTLFNQYLQSGQFGNQAQNAMFANALQNAGMTNQANQQAFNQALTRYQLPLNMFNAIRTGAQVTNPTFVNSPQQATTAGADVTGATSALSNYNLANFNAANAAQAGLNQGLFSLGGAAILASDIRTKENIKQIGVLPIGLNVYEYEYKQPYKAVWGYGKQIGVMAQEVEKILPQAVVQHKDGYLMVDYGALNG